MGISTQRLGEDPKLKKKDSFEWSRQLKVEGKGDTEKHSKTLKAFALSLWHATGEIPQGK